MGSQSNFTNSNSPVCNPNTRQHEQHTSMDFRGKGISLIAIVACLPSLMATPFPGLGPDLGSSNYEVCKYSCLDSGACEVRYTGRPRSGNTKGSCFPASFGGRCSGTPSECQDCNRVKNCENAPEPEPEQDGCPANGRYPNTDVFCVNEDGSTNCQQDSDCPEESDTCHDDPQGSRVCYSLQFKTPVTTYTCSVNNKRYGSSYEACLEDCRAEECIPVSTVFAPENVKTISSTAGQSYSGLRGVGRISRRCPATRPCPYRSGKCGRLVGLGRGGRIPACPRRRV